MKLLIAALVAILISGSLVGRNVDAQTRTVEQSLSWTDNSDNESGFIVYRKKGDGSYEEIARTPANVSKIIVSVTGAVGSNWCYAVSAFNFQFVDGTGPQQESAKSNDACATIPPASQTPPNPPSGLQAEALSPTSAMLQWNNPDDALVSIFRAAMQGSGSSREIVLAGGSSFLDDNLRKNSGYCYWLRALPIVESELLETACIKTPNR